VRALERPASGRNPILIKSGDNAYFGEKIFRFEKWWLEKETFRGLVVKAWDEPCNYSNVMDK
jgi:hypothetical protein